MGQPRLQGQVALITGAGSGIGAATARIFAQEGASVFLVDADAQGLERTRQAIVQANPEASVLCAQADVSDPALALQTVAHCVQELGGLDILVNNAAMRNYSAAGQATAAEWHAIVGVNLVGITNYCHAALPHLRSAGRGSIVNVSSCYAVKGRKGMALYDATKAAQLALTRSLACEEAAHGVRVNAVCPGSTLTDFHVGRAQKIGKSVIRQ
jgi:meso-butanediol dehydrogenase/(S,S)-butanediol dehydrogenase/diacetyl reductase